MNDLGSDQSIENTLKSASAALWDQLFDAAHGFLGEPEHTAWDEGQQVGTAMVEGEEQRVFRMPYAGYSENVDEIVKLFYEIGIVHPFEWAGWDGIERYRGRTALRSASVADAARMATAVVRSERFCEGAIDSAIRDGTFGAILERLLRWYDAQRRTAD